MTILIGIALKTGEPIAGVIHQPFDDYLKNKLCNGRTIWGIIGIGAFNYNDESLKKESGIIITTSKTHANNIVYKTMDSLNADKVIHVSGAGYKGITVIFSVYFLKNIIGY